MHRFTYLVAALFVAIGSTTAVAQRTATTASQRAADLRRAGAGADSAARELAATFRAPPKDIGIALKQAGYSAMETAGAFVTALGMTADVAFPIVVGGIPYPAVDAGSAMKGKLRDVPKVVDLLKAAGVARQLALTALMAAGVATATAGAVIGVVYQLSALQLAQELKNAGASALEVARALNAAGHSIATTGNALEDVGFDAVEIAGALKDLGLTLEQTAAELKALGFDYDQMANALVTKYGPFAAPVALALKGAGASVDQAAWAIKRAGLSLQASAAGLRAAGYATILVGRALVATGETVTNVATALHAAGVAAVDLALFLSDQGQTPDQAGTLLRNFGIAHATVASALRVAFNLSQQTMVTTLKAIGYDAQQVVLALSEAFALSMQAAFMRMAEQYNVSEELSALHALGVQANTAASWAKAAGAAPNATFVGMVTAFGLTTQNAAIALWSAAYIATDIAVAVLTLGGTQTLPALVSDATQAFTALADLMQTFHTMGTSAIEVAKSAKQVYPSLSATQLAQNMLTGGYVASEIAAALAPLYGMSVAAVQTILNALSP